MVLSVNSTLSALDSFGVGMQVTANNVANGETEGFKKSRSIFTEGAHDEVRVKIEKVDTPGPVVYEMENDQIIEKEHSNVDLAEEISGTIPIQRGYEANLKMIKTQDEMLGSIIDLIS